MKEIREARRERDKEEEEEIRGTKRKKRRLRLYVGGYTAGCTRVLRKDDAPCDISTIDGSMTTHLLTFCSPSFLFCPVSVLNEIRLFYSAPSPLSSYFFFLPPFFPCCLLFVYVGLWSIAFWHFVEALHPFLLFASLLPLFIVLLVSPFLPLLSVVDLC